MELIIILIWKLIELENCLHLDFFYSREITYFVMHNLIFKIKFIILYTILTIYLLRLLIDSI